MADKESPSSSKNVKIDICVDSNTFHMDNSAKPIVAVYAMIVLDG